MFPGLNVSHIKRLFTCDLASWRQSIYTLTWKKKIFICASVLFMWYMYKQLDDDVPEPKLEKQYVQVQQKVADIEEQTESQEMRQRRLNITCQRIKNGYYKATQYLEENMDVNTKFVTDHFHKVLYCAMGKVASSSWLDLFRDVIQSEYADRHKWLQENPRDWIPMRTRWHDLDDAGFDFVHLPNSNDSESTEKFSRKLSTYFKYLVVRHPLERLASAYIGKVLDRTDNPFVKIIKNTLRRKKISFLEADETVSFEEFVSVALLPRRTNFHWSPIYVRCQPCTVQFDFISHIETLGDDLDTILPKLNATRFSHHFPMRNARLPVPVMYKQLYRTLPSTLFQAIMNLYRIDADMFGYNFDEYINYRIQT